LPTAGFSSDTSFIKQEETTMKQTSKMCTSGIYDRDVRTETVKISELHDFDRHPFKVERDQELFELTKSIEDKGVLVPLLVRANPYGDGYEIIAGHRRKEACLWAGLSCVPVMIVDMDDEEATIAMVDSNLQREHIRPSEKAFAYKMKLEAMKQQGKKIDETLSHAETRLQKQTGENGKPVLRSDELLARQVGESRNQIARYIRLTNLIPKILDMVDEGKIAFTIAVELSYLAEMEQYELYAVMDFEQCTPSLSQANRMKRMSQSAGLDMDSMYAILEEEKPNQREQIKIRADTLADYFPSDYTPKQKIEIIEKLVKEWHESQLKNHEAEKTKKRGNVR
jgi:ParB family chromosome partitioning protein